MKFSTFVCKPCKLGITHIEILYGIFSIEIRRYNSRFVYRISDKLKLIGIDI